MIELVRTFEVGQPTGSTRSAIVVRVYKDLARPNRFFPIVFRRAFHELERSHSARRFRGEIETIDPAFPPDKLACASADAVLKAVLRRVRSLEA